MQAVFSIKLHFQEKTVPNFCLSQEMFLKLHLQSPVLCEGAIEVYLLSGLLVLP